MECTTERPIVLLPAAPLVNITMECSWRVSCLSRCVPMKPVPPVMMIFMIVSFDVEDPSDGGEDQIEPVWFCEHILDPVTQKIGTG
jgi:hypothetical protein